MKCIAIGCTSGYTSNPEKVHFFRVPKNRSEEWQKASRRKDIILNSSHCFCEKHFTEGDIVQKKILYDKNGKIIQEILLKRPHVKEGAIPTLFPWTEFTESTAIDNTISTVSQCSELNAHFGPISRLLFSHYCSTLDDRVQDQECRYMKPEEPLISWKYFEKLYDIDHNMPMPICPKITKQHLEFKNSSKMRVRLAAQILSNSVAKGLRFYSSYNHELKDSTATAEFWDWMNSLFDAFNRREYHNGLKPGNADFLFLQNALDKLDQWENLMEQGLITSNEFLTRQTAEGLRVTL